MQSINTSGYLGFGLLEALIAIVIFSGGVLGIASMQLNGLSMLSNSNALSTAVLGASDMADRMRANPQGVGGGAYDAITGGETAPACSTTCTPAQTALYDAHSIKKQLSSTLSDVTLSVTSVANDMYTIKVSWTEKVKNSTETKVHRFTFLPYKP
jgi:type IV pilus assembly protein PilV